MTRRRLAMPFALVCATLVFVRLLACSGAEVGAGPAPEGTLAPRDSAAPIDAGSPREAAAPAADPYANWVPWTELSPTCQTFVPSRPEDAPPAIRWEPCEDGPELRGLACRRAGVDWEVGGRDGTNASDAIVRDDGSLVLPILRFVKQGYLDMLVEPDGKVVTAILERDIETCRLSVVSGNGDRFGYRMRTSVRGAVTQLGLVGGSLSEGKLHLLHKYDNTDDRTIVAGNPGYIEEEGAFTFRDWNGNKLDTILSPEGRPMEDPRFFGDTLVFQHGGLAYQSLFTYTLATKRRLFRSFGNDETRGVADLGSDRKDWVWMEGYGRAPGSRDAYPHVRMMSAKVGPPDQEPVARVVRDGFVGYPFGTTPWVVGCGYAARLTAVRDAKTGEIVQPIVVVRLSDGQTHVLDSASVDTTSLVSVLGLTCDEVFIGGNERPKGKASRPNIFRIRLDSLGPDRLLPEAADAGN